MSIKVMSRIWEKSLEKGNRLLLMLAIADTANDDGWSYPSQASLALKCRVGRRAVQKMLDALEAVQEIIIYNRISDKSDEQHFSNVYHLSKYGDDPKAPYPEELRGKMRLRKTSQEASEGGVVSHRTLPGSVPPDTRGSVPPDTRVVSHRSHESLQVHHYDSSRSSKRKYDSANPPHPEHQEDWFKERWLYYGAYEQGYPDAARPKLRDTKTNRDVAQFLFANGYAALDVASFVQNKVAALVPGKNYLFEYLQEDMPRAKVATLNTPDANEMQAESARIAELNELKAQYRAEEQRLAAAYRASHPEPEET